ncbi:MAG: dipeptidase [Oscillospiraceae bacterium]|nr:dipeptidase [Oscillospiraceae bacterium]
MKVVDFHCDTFSGFRHALLDDGVQKDLARNDMHIDLEKMRRGDYMLQCFAAFVFLGEKQDPTVVALEVMDQFFRAMEKYPDQIAQVKTWADIERNRIEEKISALLTIEESGSCHGEPELLRMFYRLGARIMSLTWNFENEIAWPNRIDMRTGECSPETEHGLKDKAYAFIDEMERLGMIVDVSHLSDAGFWDVARVAKRPFIATHSNARAVCGHVRNLTDEMLRAIADKGGLTGINYCPEFIDPNPDPKARRSTVALMARHIDHIRSVGGIDMIALGSDFDGIEPPLEMYDCSCLPMLEHELHRGGFSDDEIEKIFHGNALRLLKEFLPAGEAY